MPATTKRRFCKNTLLFSLCLFVYTALRPFCMRLAFLSRNWRLRLLLHGPLKSVRNNASSYWTCRNESFFSVVAVIARELTHWRGRLQQEVTWKRNSKSFGSQNVFCCQPVEQFGGGEKRLKICRQVLTWSAQFQNRSFHDVDWTRTAVKFAKIRNARAKRAKQFFLVHMQICVVLVTVHVVVAFAIFWQRDDSEISSLKWFLLVLCR